MGMWCIQRGTRTPRGIRVSSLRAATHTTRAGGRHGGRWRGVTRRTARRGGSPWRRRGPRHRPRRYRSVVPVRRGLARVWPGGVRRPAGAPPAGSRPRATPRGSGARRPAGGPDRSRPRRHPAAGREPRARPAWPPVRQSRAAPPDQRQGRRRPAGTAPARRPWRPARVPSSATAGSPQPRAVSQSNGPSTSTSTAPRTEWRPSSGAGRRRLR